MKSYCLSTANSELATATQGCSMTFVQKAHLYFKPVSTVLHMAAYFSNKYTLVRGPGSSVGIATGYGAGRSGIESRWGRDFPRLSRPTLGPTQPPVQWVPGLSRG